MASHEEVRAEQTRIDEQIGELQEVLKGIDINDPDPKVRNHQRNILEQIKKLRQDHKNLDTTIDPPTEA